MRGIMVPAAYAKPAQFLRSLIHTFNNTQAKRLVLKVWLHEMRHDNCKQEFEQSFIRSMNKSADPKAGCFWGRPVVIVPFD